MATTPLTVAVSAFDVTTVYQTIYTVPTSKSGAGIDAIVFNNYSSSKIKYSVRIVQSGTATILNEVITNKDVRAEDPDLAPSMIGQALISGAEVQAKASANNSVSATMTVTEISK